MISRENRRYAAAYVKGYADGADLIEQNLTDTDSGYEMKIIVYPRKKFNNTHTKGYREGYRDGFNEKLYNLRMD